MKKFMAINRLEAPEAVNCRFQVEAQLRRMAGVDDGVVDALLRLTQPLFGSYFWCPPLKRGGLDFRRLLK